MSASQGLDNPLSNEVVRTLASELQRLRSQVTELESERLELNARARSAEARIQKQCDDMKLRFDARIAGLTKENAQLQQDLDVAQKAAAASKKSLQKNMRANSKKAKRDLDERSRQIMAQRLEHNSVVEKLKKQVSELTGALARKQVRVDSEIDHDTVRIPTARASKTTSAQVSAAVTRKGASLSSPSGGMTLTQAKEVKEEQNEVRLHTDHTAGSLAASGLTARTRVPVRLANTLATSDTLGCRIRQVSSNHLSHKRASDDDQGGSRKTRKQMLVNPFTLSRHSS